MTSILLLLVGGCLSEMEQNYFEQKFDQTRFKLSDSSPFLNSPVQTGFVQFSSVKPNLMPIQVRRNKRSLPPSASSPLSTSASSSGVAEDVCPSVSDWVAKVSIFLQTE